MEGILKCHCCENSLVSSRGAQRRGDLLNGLFRQSVHRFRCLRF